MEKSGKLYQEFIDDITPIYLMGQHAFETMVMTVERWTVCKAATVTMVAILLFHQALLSRILQPDIHRHNRQGSPKVVIIDRTIPADLRSREYGTTGIESMDSEMNKYLNMKFGHKYGKP